MHHWGFLNKSETKAWDFLEEFMEKTLQWETTTDESLGARISSQKEGIYVMMNTTYINTRFTILENLLKGFVLSQASINFPLQKWFHALNVSPPTIP